MKTLAYIPLHYGKEYLRYAIESVYDSVDQILILYTQKPSYGHGTNIKNPDTSRELMDCVSGLNKVNWMNVNVNGEGKHRDLAIAYAKRNGYDIVLAVDADEVWEPNTVDLAIKQAFDGKERRYATNHKGWITFYRSFNDIVTDGFEPIRLTNMNRGNNDQGRVTENIIYHFGYANCERLQAYKMAIHGHKDDIQRDWFTKKWLNFDRDKTEYMHPATDAYWIKSERFDKTVLPELLKKHPYYNLDKIV